MSLDKAIKYGKEHRKPYRGAAVWDSHCRNNNYCSWCRDNRTHSNQLREYRAREESLSWESEHNVTFDSLHGFWMDEEASSWDPGLN